MSPTSGSFANTSSDDACRRIVDALDALRIGVAMYDRDDRLTYYNTHFQYIFRSFGLLDDLIGIEFRELLMCKLNAGEIAGPHVVADPEGWIERQLARRRNPTHGPIEERLTDGRWIRISERTLKDAGTISIYTDITGAKSDSQVFEDAVEGSADALAFWDQNDRLGLRNSAFIELFSVVDDDVAPATLCQDVFDVAARHLFDTEGDDPASWVAERHKTLPAAAASRSLAPSRWPLVPG